MVHRVLKIQTRLNRPSTSTINLYDCYATVFCGYDPAL